MMLSFNRRISACKKLCALLFLLGVTGCAQLPDRADTVTISVVGSNDVHGQILPVDGQRGLPLFAGYVNNLRAQRAADDGAVVLIDAGDMWQGTLESNLTEGAMVVEAFNAMHYAAAALGNHEFDFGPAGDLAVPQNASDDPRGALKDRAREAAFPLLAANLIDLSTGQPVAWDNVQPSVLLDVSGISVGIIGVMSEFALEAIIAANSSGLDVAPLVPVITDLATRLRRDGADLVIVTAHAGSRCAAFDDPLDLSSCDTDGEIMRVASRLQPGLVDHIIAGHVHQGIAHEINGIAITSAFSSTRGFDRVDFTIARDDHTVVERVIYPPQRICSYVDDDGACAAPDSAGAVPATYAGNVVTDDDAVAAIAAKATEQARRIRSEPVGVYLETPFTLEGPAGGVESALGNLFVDAVLDAIDADVFLHNVVGGVRANLPQGELDFGSVYKASPFDNRLVLLSLSGAELRRLISVQATQGRRVSFSGMRVFVDCSDGTNTVVMRRLDDTEIDDRDELRVATTDFLAMGGGSVFSPITPDGGFSFPGDTPLVRDIFVAWLRERGGRLSADQFSSQDSPRWNFTGDNDGRCRAPGDSD